MDEGRGGSAPAAGTECSTLSAGTYRRRPWVEVLDQPGLGTAKQGSEVDQRS